MGSEWISALVVAATVVNGRCAQPERASIDPLADRTFHVSARDGIGFAAVTAGLKILDFSNLARPGTVAILPLPQAATFVFDRGDLILVAQGPAGVYAVDVSDPSLPSIVSRFDTPGSAMMLDAFHDIVAVADGSLGIALFDMSDPRDPKAVHAAHWPGGYCRGVKFRGARLYACAGREGVFVIEADRDGEWRRIGGCRSGGDARDIAFHGNMAVVADGKSGLTLLDVSDSESPRLLATTPVTDFAHGVAVDEGIVYVADGAAGIGVYRFAEPTGLKPVGCADTAKGYANKVVVHGRHLFVANDSKGILVFDITDPAEPKRVE